MCRTETRTQEAEMSAVVAWSGTVEEFAEMVADGERAKEEALAAFTEALRDGMVLVETWLGEFPKTGTVKVWHGNEYGLEKTAAHVANRYRAGWTSVEIADPTTLVELAELLPKQQRISAWDGEQWRRAVVLGVEKHGDEVALRCCDYSGCPSFTWTTPADTPVYLV
jgi:hypothetical protein